MKKTIIVVQVQKGTHAPYYLVNKGIRPEGVFVRQGTSAVPASEDAIRRMIKESDGTHFESMRSLNQSLTFHTMEEECRKRKIKFGTQQQITLGIQSPDGVYTNLGLCFPINASTLLKQLSLMVPKKRNSKIVANSQDPS